MALAYYFSQNHPADDTNPVGGDIGTIPLDTSVFFPYSNVEDGNFFWYYKFFIKNEGIATVTLQVSIDNYIEDSSDGVLTVQYNSADEGKKLRIVHYNTDWTVTIVELPEGSTTVDTPALGNIAYIELLDDSDNPTNAAADIVFIDHGDGTTQLGKIPSGEGMATQLLTFNADSSVDNTDTTPNRLTEPSGRTFDMTSSYTNTLNAGDYWAIWLCKETRQGMPLPKHENDTFSLKVVEL